MPFTADELTIKLFSINGQYILQVLPARSGSNCTLVYINSIPINEHRHIHLHSSRFLGNLYSPLIGIFSPEDIWNYQKQKETLLTILRKYVFDETKIDSETGDIALLPQDVEEIKCLLVETYHNLAPVPFKEKALKRDVTPFDWDDKPCAVSLFFCIPTRYDTQDQLQLGLIYKPEEKSGNFYITPKNAQNQQEKIDALITLTISGNTIVFVGPKLLKLDNKKIKLKELLNKEDEAITENEKNAKETILRAAKEAITLVSEEELTQTARLTELAKEVEQVLIQTAAVLQVAARPK